MSKRPGKTKSAPDGESREDRLKKALRANLQRRKEQRRSRETDEKKQD